MSLSTNTSRVQLLFVLITGLFMCAGIPQAEAADSIREKLKMNIPKVYFEAATIRTVVTYLKDKSRDYDPDGEGVDIILLESRKSKRNAQRTVTMDFDNIPLGEAIRYLCIAANLRYTTEPHAVIIAGKGVRFDNLVTRVYALESGFFSGPANRKLGRGVGDRDGDGGRINEVSPREYFENKGVEFPERAKIDFNGASGKLFVKNTLENLRRLERILDELEAL